MVGFTIRGVEHSASAKIVLVSSVKQESYS
jgi:hypothetical protein